MRKCIEKSDLKDKGKDSPRGREKKGREFTRRDERGEKRRARKWKRIGS